MIDVGGAAEKLGRAILELDTDDAKLHKGIQRAKKEAFALGGQFARIGVGVTAATAPIALFGTTSLQAFLESRKAVAAVDAAIKSMGGAAGFTSEQLQKMAGDMQAMSTFDDDEILNRVTANLLTFGNLSGDVFRRAQQASIDLSARLGQDLQSSAVMLGKALNDPIYGLTALTRVGVAFTAEQKAMVKEMVAAGNVAGAQALILAELEKQYGGQAAALAKADGGLKQLGNQWGNFQEQIGEIVAIILPDLVSMLGSVVSWLQSVDKDTLKWIVTIGGIAVAVGPALLALGGMVAGIGALLPVIASVGTAIIGLVAATGPIGLFIAAAGLLTVAWLKWGDDIQLALTDAFEVIAITVDAIKSYIVTAFTAIADVILKPWRMVIQGAQEMYDRLVGHSIIPDMVLGVESWLGRLVSSTAHHMGAMTKHVMGNAGKQEASAESSWASIFHSFSAFSADMLNVHRIFSAAQAFISTLAGAAEALKLPFPANLAAAAKVMATGMGFVSAIKSATAGGGSSPGVARAGAAPQPADGPTQLAAQRRERDPVPTTIVHVEGGIDDDALFSGKRMRVLFDRIEEVTANGGRVIFARG